MNLTELDNAFGELLKQFPEAKKELMEDTAEKMYQKVLANIDATVDEDTGSLKKGVLKVIGSKGGYAAIRPSRTIAPHTHLLENGHKIKRRGKTRYRKVVSASRKQKKKDTAYSSTPGEAGEVLGWVPGKHMYRNALNELINELENDAEQMLENLVGGIF